MIDSVLEKKLIDRGDIIIAGVSGGSDSVCMLHVLKELSEIIGFDLLAVHVNHCIRPGEAERDQKFVEKLCRRLDVPLAVRVIDVVKKAGEEGLSPEEAGRAARHGAFSEEASGLKKRFPGRNIKLALAHNLNDNAETFLLNLARGTGIKGLSGMEEMTRIKDMTVIRPLLFADREQIEEYLKKNGLEHVEDSTNAKDEYSRNKIRHKVIPALTEINSRAVQHIVSVSGEMAEIDAFLEKITDEAYEDCVRCEKEKVLINIEGLLDNDPLISSRIVRRAVMEVCGSLKDISRVHIDGILSLSRKQTGRYIMLPCSAVAARSYGSIVIEKAGTQLKAEEGLEEAVSIRTEALSGNEKTVNAGKYRINLRLSEVTAENFRLLTEKNIYTKAFDYDKIRGTLVFRNAAPSDVIVLKGGSKTLKKYFTDEKIPGSERKKTLVLSDENGILWIIGGRIAQPCKLDENSSRALIVSVSGGNDDG